MAKQTSLSAFLVVSSRGNTASSTTPTSTINELSTHLDQVTASESSQDGNSPEHSVTTNSSLLERTIVNCEKILDSEKHHLLTTLQADISDDQFDTQFFLLANGKRKQITFQQRWLTEYTWLRYIQEESHRGGWCLPCYLFLTDLEKTSLGAFVKTPFINYNKSKELLMGHSKKQYHLSAMDRASTFISNFLHPERRIDSSLLEASSKNFEFNSKILPTIVDAVIFCARQRIALQGCHQDKIDYCSEPTQNEGKFVAVLRLLAKNNPTLDDHLRNGPRNALYTSKTVQNEILQVAADQIREFCRVCLEKCSHFSILGDEVTSHGKEILSVCIRFLEVDSTHYQVKPKKHEVLLDFAYLHRITGEAISKSILEVLKNHRIDINKCRGQACDTTSSMSSPNAGVQAYIKKEAPDADYQGCCLHSLNLVICQHAFLFFHNSPKRQRFFELIIETFCPIPTKKKIKGLCQTR